LLCAVNNQDAGSGIPWANNWSYTITGASATAIGTGQSNTTAIIATLGPGSYAATVCDNYTVGAYSDWFLPSKDELYEMFLNISAIDATAIANGGSAFGSASYWSSSESTGYPLDVAWSQYLTFVVESDKANSYKVRAVREF